MNERASASFNNCGERFYGRLLSLNRFFPLLFLLLSSSPSLKWRQLAFCIPGSASRVSANFRLKLFGEKKNSRKVHKTKLAPATIR